MLYKWEKHKGYFLKNKGYLFKNKGYLFFYKGCEKMKVVSVRFNRLNIVIPIFGGLYLIENKLKNLIYHAKTKLF